MPLRIQRLQSPNHWSGRDGHRPRYVILHGTAGFNRARDCAVYFANRSSQVSSHYIIGRDPDEEIYQCVNESDSSWANGVVTEGSDPWWRSGVNPNRITVTIEHIKPSVDNSDRLTLTQQALSFELVKEICERWNIPKRAADAGGGITGHHSMDPINRSRCPGPYPWDELWSYLRGDDDMMNIDHPFAQRHFEDRGGNPRRWHCKTKGHEFDIVGGILEYWRRAQGAFRLPCSSEIYNILPGGAAFQVFEAGVLVYDPQARYDNPGLGPVYAMHLDQDTPGLRRLMALAGLGQASNIAEASKLIEEAAEKAKQAKLKLEDV